MVTEDDLRFFALSLPATPEELVAAFDAEHDG
jgi:hypothetical protein